MLLFGTIKKGCSTIVIRISKGFSEQMKLQRKIVFGNRHYWLHILIWGFVILYFVNSGFGSFNQGVETGVQNEATIITIDSNAKEPLSIIVLFFSTILGAIMAYSFLLFFIPLARYKRKRRTLWFGVLANVAAWLFTVFISGIIFGIKYSAKQQQIDKEDFLLIFIISSIFSGITAGLFFSCYYFVELYDQLKYQKQFKKVLEENIEAETNFLRTQINPHFLFNTLNNIYSLTLTKSESAPKITNQLKHLITYMIRDCSLELVPLASEIAFLENYMDLEKLRNKAENIKIDFAVEGSWGDIEIAPLLLINFIENAFKHGAKAGIERSYVTVQITLTDTQLAMTVLNSKPTDETNNLSIKEGGGIGVKNVKRRLAILYPNKHKLKIDESKEQYAVNLTLELNRA